MQGDVRFGFLQILLIAMALSPRFLPRLEEARRNGFAGIGWPGSKTGAAAVPSAAADGGTKPPEPIAPALESRGALTRQLPDGYSGPGPAAILPGDDSATDSKPAGPRVPREAETEADGPIVTEFLPHRQADRAVAPKNEKPPEEVPAPAPKIETQVDDSKDAPLPSAESAPLKPPGMFPIPNEKQKDKPTGKPQLARRAAEAGAGPVHPYFQQYLDRKEYFVRDGDTLELIAYRLYRDEHKAAALREANSGLLKSSDAVRPGMMLKLP